MKSRISLCNSTVLKKDLTRFAPLMLLTALVLWVVGMIVTELYDVDYVVSHYMEPAMIGIVLSTPLGLFSAITLFTYLTKKRECDAMHALPLRRETLFFTKVLAALIQFALPMGIFFIFLPGNRGWWFQMLVSFCAWLLSFGIAALAMMLSGRRLAGLILHSLIYDLGSILLTFVNDLYIPLLPGVFLAEDPSGISPLNSMMSLDFKEGKLSEILLSMGVIALVGAAFLALALVAYRKRKLERAGDFLVVKWLEPVLAWWLGICAAIFFITIFTLLDGSIWVALAIGLTIGYFAARMFFARSIKVFNKKTLIGWLALVVFMAASLFVTSLDPLGVVNRVPAAAEIESVSLYDSNGVYVELYEYDFYGSNGYTTADPEEVEQFRTMHQALLEDNLQEIEGTASYHNRFYLIYDLKNGSQVCRTYYVLGGEELKQVKYFLSQPEGLVGSADIEELLSSIREMEAYGVNGGTIHTERAFLEVFLSECEAGLMYSPDPDEQSSWDIHFYHKNMGYQTVDIPLSAEKTVAWLEEYFSKQG